MKKTSVKKGISGLIAFLLALIILVSLSFNIIRAFADSPADTFETDVDTGENETELSDDSAIFERMEKAAFELPRLDYKSVDIFDTLGGGNIILDYDAGQTRVNCHISKGSNANINNREYLVLKVKSDDGSLSNFMVILFSKDDMGGAIDVTEPQRANTMPSGNSGYVSKNSGIKNASELFSDSGIKLNSTAKDDYCYLTKDGFKYLIIDLDLNRLNRNVSNIIFSNSGPGKIIIGGIAFADRMSEDPRNRTAIDITENKRADIRTLTFDKRNDDNSVTQKQVKIAQLIEENNRDERYLSLTLKNADINNAKIKFLANIDNSLIESDEYDFNEITFLDSSFGLLKTQDFNRETQEFIIDLKGNGILSYCGFIIMVDDPGSGIAVDNISYFNLSSSYDEILKNMEIALDVTNPTLELDVINDTNVNKKIKITARAKDNLTSDKNIVYKYIVKINGEDGETIELDSGEFIPAVPGDYSVTAVAYDEHGNKSEVTQSFKVNAAKTGGNIKNYSAGILSAIFISSFILVFFLTIALRQKREGKR